jgi:hypothetical protein
MNEEKDLEMPIAKNAPGFDDAPGPDKGTDRIFDFSSDLNISPVKDEDIQENGPIKSVPIQIIRPKMPAPPPAPQPVPVTPISVPTPSEPIHTSSALPTTPGQEPKPTDVERPMAPSSPVIPSNIPNREKMFTGGPVTAAPVHKDLPTIPTPPTLSSVIQSPPSAVPQEATVPIQQTTPETAIAPVPPTIPVTPAPAAIPQIHASTRFTSLVPETAQQKAEELPRDPKMKPLRTYESDVAEAMAREQASQAAIAVAEAKRRQEQEALNQHAQQPEPKVSGADLKKVFLVLLILAFLGTGVIGAYYLYSRSPLAPATPSPSVQRTVASLISSDSYSLLPTDGLSEINLRAAIGRETAKSQQTGSVREIIPTKLVDGQTMRVGGPEMISLLDIPMPNMLLRSLGPAAMIGVYANPEGENSTFVVVTSEFFQNTFAGMLQWESIMADDLKPYLFTDSILGVANIGNQISSTTPAGEQTEQVTPYLTVKGHFVDRIIRNKDVREFRDENDNLIFLYSFVDNTKLVLTTEENTLSEIISRLEKAASIR